MVLGMPEPGDVEGRRYTTLRSVRWRIELEVIPCGSSIEDLRRASADRRRRYAALRRNLLIDPHVTLDVLSNPDVTDDNPLSQNPDSNWGRFFRNAELEKTVDQDLSRLYPEHDSFFQSPGCQGMLRRILLLWCLSHPSYGYGQGMHELLAPLLYVLHVDLQYLAKVRAQYEDIFNDKFDRLSSFEDDITYNFDYKKFLNSTSDNLCSRDSNARSRSFDELDPEIQSIAFLTDPYGAEGELGIVLSEKFMEHDAYSMFDALMSGDGGEVAMADFFSPMPNAKSQSGLPFIIETSAAIYHLLSLIDSSLHSHLVELGAEPQYFALRWLRVLFGREFSLENLLLLWDELFSADNRKRERDPGGCIPPPFAIVSSKRGALILGTAVSMILHIRSSLLATEVASVCLQRLLNFPDNVDLSKLISKAKSFQALASEPTTFQSVIFLGDYDQPKHTVVRQPTYSFDSKFSHTPFCVDSYWEKKWRVAHEEAEDLQHNKTGGKETQAPRRRWSEKLGFKSHIARTESDPSPVTAARGKASVRRSLLQDLSRQLGMEEESEEPLSSAAHGSEKEKSYLLNSGSGEENSSVFSEANSNLSASNSLENESEKSSVASNMGEEHDNGDPLPVSSLPNDATSDVESSSEPCRKERKPFHSRIQWLLKLGRKPPSSQGLPERATGDGSSSELSSEAESREFPQSGREAVDQNVMDTLRCLGQSMLDHVQIVESVFQQENLSKNVLVGKGHVTAIAALKELRKISNLLTQM